MSLNEYYEKKVRIVSKNGETFEGHGLFLSGR